VTPRPALTAALTLARPTDDAGTADGGGTVDQSTYATSDLFDNLSWQLSDEIGSLATVSWTQTDAATVHVEYHFDDEDWMSTPSMDAAAGDHQQLIVGIPYGTRGYWRVVADNGEMEAGNYIVTDPLPSGIPDGTVLISEPDKWLSTGNYLLTSINQQTGGWTGGHYWTIIIDRAGRVVWAHEAPDAHWTLFVQVAQTGDHILWDESTYWSDWDDGAGSMVHRRYLDQPIDDISTPGLHHEFVQLPDETLVWGSQDHGGYEALVEQPMGSSEQTTVWTCDANWPGSGNCESNGLFYVEDTNTYLYSFYTNNSIVEVDRATGNSLWWAGDVAGGYSFDPADSQYSWQHGISYTDTGTLLVSTEGRELGRNVTMVREYEVNHDTKTLTQVWYYNPGVYASTNGDAWRLANGNTLHVIGSAGYVTEVDPDGNIIWEIDYDGTHLMGRGTLIEDLYTLVSPTSSY